MILVSNTGPLIGLAKLGRMDLTARLADTTYVPPQVQAELLAKPGPETHRLSAALKSSLIVRSPAAPESSILAILEDLDEGERQTICLALSLPPPVLVLLDDQLGRTASRKLGLRVTGLAGFLILAKQHGLLDAVTPLLLELRCSGYWLSNEVITAVRKLTGE